MEAFCLSGVDGESSHPLLNIQTLTSILLGVIGKLVKHESQLRVEVVALINGKLRTFLFYPALKNSLNYILGAISKGDANRMMYKDFDEHITRKHGIIVEDWPLRVFNNPSAIGSQVELNILLRAWQTGATRFHKMTEDEHMAWLENRCSSEPPSTGAASFLPATPPPEARNQDTAPIPLTNPSMFHSSFNVISLEPAPTPQTSNNAPKKPRKTRSDKGKPRRKGSQIPGANVFHASTQ